MHRRDTQTGKRAAVRLRHASRASIVESFDLARPAGLTVHRGQLCPGCPRCLVTNLETKRTFALASHAPLRKRPFPLDASAVGHQG